MKYIPAEKLIAEIKRQQRRLTVLSLKGSVDVRRDSALQGGVYDYILGIIDSLQQEQPEMDLEKEIFEAEKKYGDIDEMGGYQILLFDDEFRDILRHFYELGKNARKEESK